MEVIPRALTTHISPTRLIPVSILTAQALVMTVPTLVLMEHILAHMALTRALTTLMDIMATMTTRPSAPAAA